jgi:ketosteroid isomerase-like protein
MAVQSENERNKAVVDEYFKAGVQGHLTSFAAYLHPDFTVTAPNYLPWGGRHVGAAFFRDHQLPGVTDVFDFARFSYDNVVAEDGHVVAVFNIGVTGTDVNVHAERKPKTIRIPGPGHPITIEPNAHQVVVTVAGRVVADTRAASTLCEASYPPVRYIPRKDVDTALLERTDHARAGCQRCGIPPGHTVPIFERRSRRVCECPTRRHRRK